MAAQGRHAKLAHQCLTEAYGNEKPLEAALEPHIAMTSRAACKKRLRQHLTETKRHAREVEKRIKRLGRFERARRGRARAPRGSPAKALAPHQGPLHMVRGTGKSREGAQERQDRVFSEAEEIATYTTMEPVRQHERRRPRDGAARAAIRRGGGRMARSCERLIPTLRQPSRSPRRFPPRATAGALGAGVATTGGPRRGSARRGRRRRGPARGPRYLSRPRPRDLRALRIGRPGRPGPRAGALGGPGLGHLRAAGDGRILAGRPVGDGGGGGGRAWAGPGPAAPGPRVWVWWWAWRPGTPRNPVGKRAAAV